ncbi:MAG: hypothetical protein DRM98_00220 [Thermoplasmata archaeon]|nr:MAG: hypothetical protein DRM98_00220 [Thermoplasmata archaeon]
MANKKTLVSIIFLLTLTLTLFSPLTIAADDNMNIIIGVLGAPKHLTAKRHDSTTMVDLKWEKGENAETTYIVRKTGSYPQNIHDGIVIYNGTGETCIDTSTTVNTHYFYRAWSFAVSFYSQEYSQANIIMGEKVYELPVPVAVSIPPRPSFFERIKIPMYFICFFIAFLLLFILWKREEKKEEEKEKEEKEEKGEKEKEEEGEERDTG